MGEQGPYKFIATSIALAKVDEDAVWAMKQQTLEENKKWFHILTLNGEKDPDANSIGLVKKKKKHTSMTAAPSAPVAAKFSAAAAAPLQQADMQLATQDPAAYLASDSSPDDHPPRAAPISPKRGR